ncbi:MAG: chromate efflux transporter [Bermanella sp.]
MNNVFEVFWRFLLLGCISFGGPAAHLGYFQRTFVQRLKWLDDESYARLISLSQFLPGPGSSQVGFALGLRRAGLWGGVAAFMGFTLPSFTLLYFLATSNLDDSANAMLAGVMHGLKLLAVVVVADATLSMFKSFCQDKVSMGIALLTAVALLLVPQLWVQIAVLALAALAGAFCGKPNSQHKPKTSQPLSSGAFKLWPLLVFCGLLAGLPWLSGFSSWGNMFAAFYQSGSLVFGGGHVVLPLLQHTVGDAMSTDRFLMGYAAAQAVPGPMFTMATFLGAEMSAAHPLLAALLATLAIFLPGFLLLLSLQGVWESLAAQPRVAGAAWGINAAVVGLLGAALYQPVFTSAVFGATDMALVMLGFFALRVLKVPIVWLVLGFVALGLVFF